MRRLSGQAARWFARLLHATASLALLAVVLAAVGLSVLGWRLSKGPLEMPWLAARIERQVNAEDASGKLAIGTVALAWEGFSQGVDRPLDLRVTDVSFIDTDGVKLIAVPRAEVSLSLLGLLLGRIEPRAIEIEHARLKLYRSASGEISLDLGPRGDADAEAAVAAAEPAAEAKPARVKGARLEALLREFSNPAGSDRSPEHRRFRQLRRVRIVDAAVVVVDRQLQATWRAPRAEIDLLRGAAGGVRGRANMTVTLGDQTTQLDLSADLAPGGTETVLRASMTPVAPAALARAAPALAPLAALTAPVGVVATAELGPRLGLKTARATVRVGAGDLHVGSASVALSEATFAVSGDPQAISLDSARVALRGHPGGPPTVLGAHGTLHRAAGHIRAEIGLTLDQVAFADLPALWPEGVGQGARNWITGNITAGTARDGKVDVALEFAPDLSDATLTAAHGTLDGDGLTVWWLRPVPPIEQGVAQLRILDPDTLEIAVQSGRQRGEGAKANSAGVTVHDGTVRITGIMQHDQFGKISADLSGPVPDVLALLRSPRLHLFDHTSVDLRDPAGQVTGKVTVALPLRDEVTMDEITVGAEARLEGVHLTGIVAGHDLDGGALDMKADNNGMTIAGTAALATIPSTVNAAFDFRAGPPTQTLQTVTVSGKPSAAQLAAIGLAPGGIFVGGTVAVSATLTERRDGQGQVAANADLTDAALRLDLAGWTKPAGAPAQAQAVVRLQKDRLTSIDDVRLMAPDATVEGRARFANGRADVLDVSKLSLGKTRATGTVRFPGREGGPVAATVTGSTIDLSARLTYKSEKAGETPTDRVSSETAVQGNPPGQPWSLDARFDRAIMANGQTFTGLALKAEDNGARLTRLRLDAQADGNAPIAVEVAPAQGGRRLTASAADAGGLLRALDIMKTMEGGRLSVNGHFDDHSPGDPLSGTAEIEEFRVRNAPAMARVLQAMTLYGVVDM
ncbi:MAG: hypothetical protein JSR21_19895, partial [Proteobacteria bacterium]|nr:hypothetical protein [Pseudomonadota bacterium]